MTELAVITPSYAPDLELCVEMREFPLRAFDTAFRDMVTSVRWQEEPLAVARVYRDLV
jgi:hypothetical protein